MKLSRIKKSILISFFLALCLSLVTFGKYLWFVYGQAIIIMYFLGGWIYENLNANVGVNFLTILSVVILLNYFVLLGISYLIVLYRESIN